MTVSVSKVGHFQTGPFYQRRNLATERRQLLMEKLNGNNFESTEFDNLRTLIESLPQCSADGGIAADHLRKAQRYLRSDEVGSAQYELRLLFNCLPPGV